VEQCFFSGKLLPDFYFLKPWLPIQREKEGFFHFKAPKRNRQKKKKKRIW
jgi:hypothetical protein